MFDRAWEIGKHPYLGGDLYIVGRGLAAEPITAPDVVKIVPADVQRAAIAGSCHLDTLILGADRAHPHPQT